MKKILFRILRILLIFILLLFAASFFLPEEILDWYSRVLQKLVHTVFRAD